MTLCPYEDTGCDFTCPYCHHPSREADAVQVCRQAAASKKPVPVKPE